MGEPDHGMTLDERVRGLLDATSIAVLCTLNADGSPHSSSIWVAREGDDVVFTTHDGRKKTRNMQRDPRVALTVIASGNPYDTVDIRGVVELVPDPDRAYSELLTRKYLGEAPPADPPGTSRFVGRLTPTHVTGFAAG